jgi:hypothetical protein
MVIKAVKPGIRPAIRPAIKPAAAAPAPAEDVVEQAVADETAAETVTETVAAPAAAAKPAAAPKAAAKPAVKAAAAKPAAAPKAAAPAAEVEAAPAASRAKKPGAVVGSEARKFEVELPAEMGGRITLDNVQELFHRYMQQHAAELDIVVNNKVASSKLLEAVFKFLIGDSPEAEIEGTADAISANGGLVLLYEAKLMDGIHFKHDAIDNRRYRNPRAQGADDAYVRVQGRRSVKMELQIDAGETTYEAE